MKETLTNEWVFSTHHFLTSLLQNISSITLLEVKDKVSDKLVCALINKVLLLDKPECKKCAKVLLELENIDDEADQLGIGFVKINDEALAEEYNLGDLPALVYYRHQTPIIYEGIASYFHKNVELCEKL